MFEAKLQQGGLLKKILESVKDLVVDGLWDCDGAGKNCYMLVTRLG